MVMYLVVSETAWAALETDLLAAAPPQRAEYVGPAIAHLVPESWDGRGPVPVGWSRQWELLGHDATADLLVSTSEEVAAALPAYAWTSSLPSPWSDPPVEE